MSVPGYIEIFSGRPAVDCLSNRCRWSGERNLLDQIAEDSRGRPADVAVFASWPGMLRTVSPDSRGVLVSAGRKGRQNLDPLLDDPEAAELYARGARSDSYPGQGDYRPDRHTAELALYHLRRHRPRFMLLSLGDADKFGHANMYRRYLEALHESDKVVAQAAHVLDELARPGLAVDALGHSRSRSRPPLPRTRSPVSGVGPGLAHRPRYRHRRSRLRFGAAPAPASGHRAHLAQTPGSGSGRRRQRGDAHGRAAFGSGGRAHCGSRAVAGRRRSGRDNLVVLRLALARALLEPSWSDS